MLVSRHSTTGRPGYRGAHGRRARRQSQEHAVTEQIDKLVAVACDEGDYLGEQFMGWFLKEQVEAMALMARMLPIADRATANLFELGNFVAREIGSPPRQAHAPRAAGGRTLVEL